MVPHPVFLISGLSLRFGDVEVGFSSDHFHTDAIVPSSDHCLTETVLPPSDRYCIETVESSGDHYCIDIVLSSSCCCLFMVDPVGPMVQQTFTIRLHVNACYTKSSVFSKTVNTVNTVVRGASSTSASRPRSQITCRLGVPSAPVSGQHEQAYSPYQRTQNERHSSVQIKR